MKTIGQRVGELLDAMNNGCILVKEHKDIPYVDKEFLFKSGKNWESKGWGTAFGTSQDRILDIVKNPDDWKIFPDFNMNNDSYPYPWSSKWKEKL